MKIRIVTDKYAGYEVQVWRWWWPFWWQHGSTNTHSSVTHAEKYITDKVMSKNFVQTVVKYVEV